MNSRTVLHAIFTCVLAITPALRAEVIINEIHYAPIDKTVHEEFVELTNRGVQAIDISGWELTDAVRFVIPDGVSIPPGGFVVIAQDPAVLQGIYGAGFPVHGPFEGRLANDSDEVKLRDHTGLLVDEVDYQMGFPWPTVGGDEGDFSIELVNPDFDNDLGGSWRASDPGLDGSSSIVAAGSTWRYRKGLDAPPASWREPDYEDGGWSSGVATIGYGDGHVVTQLDDMRDNYSSFYMRRTFEVADASSIAALALDVQHDDGFNAYINGVWVAGNNVDSNDEPHTATANSALENSDYVEFPLPPPSTYLVDGTNVLAIHVMNASLGGSSDAWCDARLDTAVGAGSGPTPGRANNTLSSSLPPHLRQVDHEPRVPRTGDLVKITVKATDPDGIASVELQYQIVEPGAYVNLTDPEYATDWTTIPMNDARQNGDFIAGDDIYTGALTSDFQRHRRLVRYRIVATDNNGNTIRAPYGDDPVPNFAYFVYDGVPAWTGSPRPGVLANVTYSPELLASIPVYFLITKRQDHLNSQSVPYRWQSPGQQLPSTGSYGGSDYLWQGTMVYDGRVYDHIAYRARGGVWRYSMGKNMWKFNFRRGHRLRARDDYGRRYDTEWDKLNFSAIIQQGNFGQRGEQGLFEAVGFKLHNLASNPAPYTHFVHFRLVEDPAENGPDQYSGEFRGLYLAIEQPDGNLLDEHGLPDGNFYKMEGGSGELNNQGWTQPTNKADLNAFKGTYESGGHTEQWWRDNLDLEQYYSFRAISMAIHDYDMHAGKNYFYFHNPEDDRWSVINWDLDLCWTTTYNGGGGRGPLNRYVLDPYAVFRLEYRNRVRELGDLLFNLDQTGEMLDEAAHVVFQPDEDSFVDADRSMWNYNPILVSSYINSSKAGHNRYYESASPRTFEAMLGRQKSYAISRSGWMSSNQDGDNAIPGRPTVTYQGPGGYPIDGLAFRSGAFSDPQGAGTFAAMKWRIAEVTPPGQPAFDPLNPKIYEIDAEWESEEITPFAADITIPDWVARPGERYRVRVKMQDTSGRWSHWSTAHEFTPSVASAPFPQEDALRVTEVMYNPPAGRDFEFIELVNRSGAPVDLTHVSFTDGVNFDFIDGDFTVLPPGEFVLLVKNQKAFMTFYDLLPGEVNIAGEFSGRLDNAGDRLKFRYGKGTTIQEFTYSDLWIPITDGGGHSLTVVDVDADLAAWNSPTQWVESVDEGGSPGWADSGPPPGGLQRPGDLNQDNYLDIGDAFALLLQVFRGGTVSPPCEGATIVDGSNRTLADFGQDGEVDATDAIQILTYLFLDGPAHGLGPDCIRLEGCPNVCSF